ncbi:hypothetical protein A2995_00060 [Candidatus Nomurabacteria bacterium RIFCSPLOWO2_01_FULL_33_24]|uniref:Bacterial type II secretion system protein E domain-containing protein n=1 Tax=Candidatus Nomurabacteria bacterium RIFCSPLOWO2_01_FULL_33_24 TaxID=1801765 RepID=A0A1F6X1Z8_9BACT|nr:MAG: hypothetical protein A2995_00060 [Candidatus Nomurabacteria bacterium RIFCSPLOWO2_01_FULL_33_24]
MYIKEDQLEKFILESGLVSKNDVDTAHKEAKNKKQSLEAILLNQGKISEIDLKRVEAYILGIPFISLVGEKIDPDILSLIPELVAKNHNIIAFKKTSNGLQVAMLDVDDLRVIDFVKKKVGIKIIPMLTDDKSIKEGLLQYKRSLEAEFDDIIKKETGSIKTIALNQDNETSETDLKKLAEDLPIIKIVDTLISHAILQDASDIHIEPGEKELVIRYRIDGILRDAMVLPKKTSSGVTARVKVLSNLKLDEKRLPQDGRFKILTEDNQKVSFRVSVIPSYYGEKTVIRILKATSYGYTLEDKGFHGEGLERIHDSLKQRSGMILVAGPTGSGKTTTLYVALDILNTPDVNISTIEDPIEYQMPRITQTQIKPDIGLSFANGLRSLLRQDPDIIMVGEIRDNETASLAVNASLTGHLVLSTIHTNSAAGVIPRLIDMEVEPFLIVSTLKTIIAQRLVRKLGESREKYFLSPSELKVLSKIVKLDRMLELLKEGKIIGLNDTWEKVPFYKPKKSKDCIDGYGGRLGIHEVLKVTSSIKELIIRSASTDEIEEQAKSEGMMTMVEDGIFKSVQGQTTIEEVLRVVSE